MRISRRSGVAVYKSGQGMASRIGVLALIVAFGAYAGYSWYGFFYGTQAASIGAVVVLGLFAGVAVFTAVKNPKSCDFLIEMDAELRKVVWPDTKPIFDPKAEAWGATYVVIITVIIFALFIYVVDLGLAAVLQDGLFPLIFGGK